MNSWSVIIFCYNEVNTIERVIDQANEVLPQISSSFEIIVVDDGSTDGSKERISDYQGDKVVKIFHPKNKGIGPTLRSGYRIAQNERVVAVPADGQFNLEELLPFSKIEENEVISFFRIENAFYNGYKNFMSLANKTVNKKLLGLKLIDVNWVKVYPAKYLNQLQMDLTSSLVESELCAKLGYLGCEFRQVESQYQKRVSGEEKGHSFKIIYAAIKDIIPLIRAVRKFRKTDLKKLDVI